MRFKVLLLGNSSPAYKLFIAHIRVFFFFSKILFLQVKVIMHITTPHRIRTYQSVWHSIQVYDKHIFRKEMHFIILQFKGTKTSST